LTARRGAKLTEPGEKPGKTHRGMGGITSTERHREFTEGHRVIAFPSFFSVPTIML
jgi:hypothetical protein